MAATRISTAAAIAAVNAIVDLLDADASPGYIEIRTGSAPATLELAATGTLLGTCTLNATAFGTAVDTTNKATATANAITSDTSADADGTAAWFRAYDGAGTPVIQGDVSDTGGAGDLKLDSVSITTGDTIAIDSWTISLPEA